MVAHEDPLACLIHKLEKLAPLDEVDRNAIRSLPRAVTKEPSGRHLIREGTRPSDCCLLVKGFACRYKVNSGGGRQIVSFHVPGDLLDLQHLYLAVADHHVQTISPAEIVWITKSKLRALAAERPNIAEALWRDALIDASIFREWVLNVGRRDAKTGIAHMLCEFVTRASAAGLGPPEGFSWPLTQEQIADATGITSVHVNRTMKALREDGVIERHGNTYRVRNWDKFRQVADFDQTYLHAAAA
jgi:CRP-like cAMP-binding protein